MNNHHKKTIAILVLAVAYAVLFYKGQMGVNLLIFDGLLLTLTLWLRPELGKHRPFVWSVAGLLFSAVSVVIVNTDFSLLAHHATYLLVLGFAQARELRFIWFGLLLGGVSLFAGPLRWWRSQRASRAQLQNTPNGTLSPWLKQVALPLLVAVPFLFFYLTGNGQFSKLVSGFFGLFSEFNISPTTFWVILLMLVAGFLSAGLLFPTTREFRLIKLQSAFRDDMIRSRPERQAVPPQAEKNYYSRPSSTPNPMALRYEYRQSVITFGLLNVLLAAVNLTDLRYVWLNASELSASTLSHYVHVGTWNLVISIFLAMAVVLFYFRGNLNFLKEATALPPLARLWLAQNSILAISVGVRNWHYIDAYGLAMGRVYVFFVLLLMLFGLFTLWRKVGHRLTISYLFQANGMALWLALIVLGAVNWTNGITRYNLATQEWEEVDWYYLVNVLPASNAFLIEAYDEAHPGETSKGEMHRKMLPNTHRIADWRSWNYADWRNWRELR
ncbi:DUF4153 domain-containing protein [Neolewinella agarilytica]|uniref:DUF4173 domain-containing protein n=1 Tax=Neolewinella agarilytica TaxID=478744 RepID=A0A1H9NNQ7_9BACT|nr:DUF4173 domain-containing protein [Neolewinella agarilytica]SER37265.1 protein of unknown function [Neolewinella agarilytica]